jgi:hypothetical protein
MVLIRKENKNPRKGELVFCGSHIQRNQDIIAALHWVFIDSRGSQGNIKKNSRQAQQKLPGERKREHLNCPDLHVKGTS